MALRKEKMKAQASEALGGLLDSREREEALAWAISGPSPWLAQGLLGLIGQIFMKYYFVALTNQRLVFIKAGRASQRPDPADSFAVPRADVETESWSRGLWSTLRIRLPGGRKMRLNFPRNWRDEAERIATGLGASIG